MRKIKFDINWVWLALLGMNTDPRKSLPANLFLIVLCLCEVRSIVGTDYGEYFTTQILSRLKPRFSAKH